MAKKKKKNVLNSAVDELNQKIQSAIKGPNPGPAIKQAVWDMLKGLSRQVPEVEAE